MNRVKEMDSFSLGIPTSSNTLENPREKRFAFERKNN